MQRDLSIFNERGQIRRSALEEAAKASGQLTGIFGSGSLGFTGGFGDMPTPNLPQFLIVQIQGPQKADKSYPFISLIEDGANQNHWDVPAGNITDANVPLFALDNDPSIEDNSIVRAWLSDDGTHYFFNGGGGASAGGMKVESLGITPQVVVNPAIALECVSLAQSVATNSQGQTVPNAGPCYLTVFPDGGSDAPGVDAVLRVDSNNSFFGSVYITQSGLPQMPNLNFSAGPCMLVEGGGRDGGFPQFIPGVIGNVVNQFTGQLTAAWNFPIAHWYTRNGGAPLWATFGIDAALDGFKIATGTGFPGVNESTYLYSNPYGIYWSLGQAGFVEIGSDKPQAPGSGGVDQGLAGFNMQMAGSQGATSLVATYFFQFSTTNTGGAGPLTFQVLPNGVNIALPNGKNGAGLTGLGGGGDTFVGGICTAAGAGGAGGADGGVT